VSDAALVKTARGTRGGVSVASREAMHQLLRRYAAMARALAIRSGCRPSDVEDALQDAAIEAMVSLPSLRIPEAFRSWYGRVVIHVSRRRLREDSRRQRLGLAGQDDDDLEDRATLAVTPERIVGARQLQAALEDLPEKIQRTIELRHLEGQRIEDVAALLGASPASVKRYLFAAESRLRHALDEDLRTIGERLPARKPRRRPSLRNAALALLWPPSRPEARGPWPSGGATLAAAAALLGLVAAVVVTRRAPAEPPASPAQESSLADGSRPQAAAPESEVTGRDVAPRPGETLQVDDTVFLASALPAELFGEATGVNVRLGEDPQPEDLVRARLAELGVRHVLDVAGSRLDWLARLEPLGIKTNLFLEPDTDAHALLAPLGSFVEAVTFKQSRGDLPLPQWARRQRDWMESTHRALKADPRTRGVAIVGATMSNDDKRNLLGDVSAFVDFGASGAPSRRLPPGGAFLDATLAVYRPLYGRKPVIVPQVTHSTATCDECVDEAQQARYVLRTLLEHQRRGVARTYGAYLFDAPVREGEPAYESGKGLLRSDGSHKASFTTLARALRFFDDRGHSGPPGPTEALRFDVQPVLPHVEHLLYQRRDGTLLLVTWLAVAGASELTSTELRLRLPVDRRARRLHDLAAGTTSEVDPGLDGWVSVPVGEDPSVLEIGPG
jgi:RNA polymerase sigma-70 factor (ECF subfamily)